MIFTKRFALIVGALSIVAAGCSSASVAATVNGSEIEDSTVLGIRVENEGQVTVSGEQMRNDLSRLIFTEALVTAAEEDFGLADLDSQETRDAYLATATPDEEQYLQSVAADPTLTEAAIDVVVVQLVLRSEVHDALAQDEEILTDIWENDPASLVQVCASHILVASEEEAIAVTERLDAGEEFATVASEVSLDTNSPGGALPCPSPAAAYVDPFANAIIAAPIGEPTPPVQTQFGFHIIVVDSRQAPASFEELAADPLLWIPPETIDVYWNEWIDASVADAEIDVRSDIGLWYPPADGIVPPPPSP